MFDWIKENSIAFIIALTLHLVFLGALLFNWEFDKPEKIVLKQGDIIQATAVDANSFEAEIRKIEQQKQAEKQRKAQAERKARELKEKQKQEKKRKAEELKRKKAAAKKKEEQRKAALLKEKQRKEQELKDKKLKEKQRKEAEKKAAEAKRKEAEAKRKEQARKKAEQEKRRKAEEKKRQQAELKRKAEEEKKRQAELQRQQERQRAEQERLSKGIVNRHVALISQKIERYWRQPPGSPANLECKVDIKLSFSGIVLSVKSVGSSGDPSFDRSCETAVRKASPLPVPKDSVIFKKFEFENMRLRFEPGSN